MKKLLPTAVLTLVVSGLVTAQSYAGCCFGLFPKCCGCCGCGAKFCVRQYNAFSPVCSGTVFCDGCCPFGACGGGYGGYGGFGGCAGGMCGPGGCGVMPFTGMLNCGPGGCGDGACLGSLPATEPAIDAANAPATPATPLPTGPTSQIVNDRPIQNAAFRPASFTLPSTIAPVQMQPQMMAAPSYWGN
ncbi:MAG TPA: hypothetical protein VMF69_27075 [Gemmataceae bacterium]|nr:hypothetical protein [Gemmataceae bacterium]